MLSTSEDKGKIFIKCTNTRNNCKQMGKFKKRKLLKLKNFLFVKLKTGFDLTEIRNVNNKHKMVL
jgi:hypothetical protein